MDIVITERSITKKLLTKNMMRSLAYVNLTNESELFCDYTSHFANFV